MALVLLVLHYRFGKRPYIKTSAAPTSAHFAQQWLHFKCNSCRLPIPVPLCPSSTMWSFLSPCATVPSRLIDLRSSVDHPEGTAAIFPDDAFDLTRHFFFFTAGMRSSRESEPPALATEVSSAPALVGSDLVPVSFLATFRPSDTFRCGRWHYSVVCVCLSVCDCSVLLCLCRSSVHEPAESPGDHRRQPAETIWKLATQGEWVHVSQPLPVLLHCFTATRWHACTEYNRCLLHKEFNQIMPLIKPHKLFSPTGYWSHIASHRSYKQFAVLMVVVIGCFTSCSKDFLQTLQSISLKLSVNLTATGGFFCC